MNMLRSRISAGLVAIGAAFVLAACSGGGDGGFECQPGDRCQCSANADCPTGEECRAFACQPIAGGDTGGADAGNDVVDEEVSEPTCEPDLREPNDGLDQLARSPRCGDAFTLCVDDEDWFDLSLDRRSDVEIAITTEAASLDAVLLDASGEETLATAEPGEGGGFVIRYTTGEEDEDAVLRLSAGDAGIEYSLCIEEEELPCADDAAEENDTAADAAPVPDDGLTARLCPADLEDWFSFTAPAGQERIVTITAPKEPGLTVELFDVTGEARDRIVRPRPSAPDAVTEEFVARFDAFAAEEAVTKTLRITAEEATNDGIEYALSAVLEDAECSDLDIVDEPNDAPEAGVLVSGGCQEAARRLCPDNDDWFEVRLEPWQDVTVTVETEADLAVELYNSGGSELIRAATEVEGGYEVSMSSAGATRRLKVRVSGLIGDELGALYNICVDRSGIPCEDDDCEENDLAGAACAIETPPSPITEPVAWDGRFCGTEREQDWYKFDIEMPQQVGARISGASDTLDLLVTICSDCTSPDFDPESRGACSPPSPVTVAPVLLQAGTHCVRVSSADPVLRDEYSVELTFSNAPDCAPVEDDFEPNQSCRQALDTAGPLLFRADGSLADPTSVSSLTLCEADTADYYAMSLREGESYRVEVQPVSGQASADVVGPNGGVTLGSTLSSGAIEVTGRAAEPGNYCVRVRHPEGAGGGVERRLHYGFTAEKTTCRVDPVDLARPNESASAATQLNTSQTYSRLAFCPGNDEVDWYLWRNITRGSILDFSITPPTDVGLQVAVFANYVDSTTPTLASRVFAAGSGTRHIVIEAPVSGNYFIRVRPTSFEERSEYTIRLDSTFGCPGDIFDESATRPGSPATAAPVEPGEYIELFVCDDPTRDIREDDFLSFDLPAFHELEIEIDYQQSAGNLTATILDAATLDRVVEAPGEGGRIRINFRAREDRELLLWVRGEASLEAALFFIPYDLRLDISDLVESCLDDGDEDNDSLLTASPIVAGGGGFLGTRDLGARVINGDDLDFYGLCMQTNDELTVDVTHEAGFGAVEVALHALDGGEEVARAEGDETSATLSVTAPAAGCYAVEVAGVDATCLDYEIQFDVDVGVCREDELFPNVTRARAASIELGTRYDDLAICGTGGASDAVDWFTFSITEPTPIEIFLENEVYHGDLSMTLFGPDCILPDLPCSFRSATASNHEVLSLRLEQPGAYHIKVENASDIPVNHYALSTTIDGVRFCSEDSFESSEGADNAIEITLDIFGFGSLRGRRLCADDTDAFRIAASAGDQLRIRADAVRFEGITYSMVLPGGEKREGLLSASETIFEPTIREDGDLLLTFSRASVPGPPFPVNVTVQRSADRCLADDHEPNDVRDDARELSFDQKTSGVLCGADVDWFSLFSVATSSDIVLSAETSGLESGALELSFFDASTPGNLRLVQTTTVELGADYAVVPDVSFGNYLVRARLTDPSSEQAVAYRLTIGTLDAAGCPSDALGSASSSADAPTIDPTGASACTAICGDEQWHALTIPEDMTLTAALDPEICGGGLDGLSLRLVAPDGSTDVVVASDAEGRLALEHTPDTTGTFYLVVGNTTGSVRSAGLTWSLDVGVPDCSPDTYEPNDSAAAASEITDGVVDGTLCDSADFFRIPVTSSAIVRIDLQFYGEGSPPSVFVLRPDELADAELVSQAERFVFRRRLSIDRLEPEPTELIVAFSPGVDFEGSYQLAIDVEETCINDEDAPDSVGDPNLVTDFGEFAATTQICPRDDEDWYRLFIFDSQGIYGAVVDSEDDALAPSLTIYSNDCLEEECVLAQSDPAALAAQCASAFADIALHDFLTFRVSGTGEEFGAYDIRFERSVGSPECSDDDEGNETADSATIIEAGALESLLACLREDDWFGVELEAGQGIDVSLEALSTNANLDLELAIQTEDGLEIVRGAYDCSAGGESLRWDGPIDATDTALIRVINRGPRAQARYTLDVMVDELDPGDGEGSGEGAE